MTIMESMSQAEFDEIKQGIKSWLEDRQNQALYVPDDNCVTIELLLQDLALSAKHNLFPWEDK
jgi:hypothetical protein